MSTISSSISISQSNISTLSWPVTVNGGSSNNPTIITLDENLTLNNSNHYFIIGSNYVTIDGNNKTITISELNNSYSGLVQNGTSTISGYSNIVIKNMTIMTTNNSCTTVNSGWFGWAYFTGSNNTFTNCINNGPNLNTGTSGIVGAYSSAYVSYCTNNGNVSGHSGGGIFGAYPQSGSMAVNCINNGPINESGDHAGGIFGRESSGCTALRCKNFGNIGKTGCGGIFGVQATNCTANECAMFGNLEGGNSGGIFGYMAQSGCVANKCIIFSYQGYNQNNDCGGIFAPASTGSAINCYNMGVLHTNCGGIFGYYAGAGSTVTNCIVDMPRSNFEHPFYISDDGMSGANVSVTNSYANTRIFNFDASYNLTITNLWSDSVISALISGGPQYTNGVLTNPIGTDWCDVSSSSSNTSWCISNFGNTPYSTDISNTIVLHVDRNSPSITALNTSDYNYFIIAINNLLPSSFPEISIDNLSGSITLGDSNSLNYNITVYQKNKFNSDYSITNVILNISTVLTINNIYSVDTISKIYYQDTSFNIDISFTGIVPYTLSSSNTNVCTVINNIIYIVGAGTCSINVITSPTEIYHSASKSITVNVDKYTPNLSWSPTFVTYIDVSLNLTDPSSNSDGAFTFTSSDTSIATINGRNVTILLPGTVTITATQASTSNFYQNSVNATLTINKPLPTIYNFNIPSKTYGDPSFNLIDPSSNSDGAFTFTSSNLSVLSILNNIATIHSRGTVTVTATQAESDYFGPGLITYVLTILSPPISNICFVGTVNILTNNGYKMIQDINKHVDTINGMKIISVVKSNSTSNYLVKIPKNFFGENLPFEDIICSPTHKIEICNKMVEAKNIMNVQTVEYNGELLYNILLEQYDSMVVNGIKCETLFPNNDLAKSSKYIESILIDETNESNILNKIICYYQNKNLINIKKLNK